MTIDASALLATFLRTIHSPLFALGAQPISILWLGQCTLLLIAVLLSAKWSKLILKNRVLVSVVLNKGDREVISSLAGFAIGAIGFVIALQGMGLKLDNLAIIVGGMGVGIGFGLQDLTKNLVSGITVLGERKLKVGDLIEYKGVEGYIQEISIRSTVISTFRGSALIIPNTQLTDNQVENWSYQSRRGRIEIPLLVEPESDLLLVTELLLRIASMEPAVLSDPAPKVLFKGFADAGLNFELRVWIDHIDRGATVKSAMNFLIEYHFRKNGIKISYPKNEPGMFGRDETRVRPALPNAPQASQGVFYSPTQPLRDMLRDISYFHDFDEIQLRGLIELGTRRVLQNGEVFVEQGKHHQAFCIVLSGGIDAIYENDKISQRVFKFGVGDFFGELPILLNLPYPTTMRAEGETTLFMIGSEGFHYLLGRYPHLKETVTEELTKRQASIQFCQATLRNMGLLADEEAANPVAWLRSRLGKLLSEKLR